MKTPTRDTACAAKPLFPDLRVKLAVSAAYLAAVAVMNLCGIHCLFFRFLRIPCPGCGITRALLAALRLDFARAFRFNFMFWAVPPAVFVFFTERFPFGRRAETVFFSAVGVGFAAQWVLHILSENFGLLTGFFEKL